MNQSINQSFKINQSSTNQLINQSILYISGQQIDRSISQSTIDRSIDKSITTNQSISILMATNQLIKALLLRQSINQPINE